MKIKVLSRNPDDYLRETKRDIHKLPRNYDPSLHPFQAPREYVRALNATKLERVFAKPFVGSLDGHGDGVTRLAKHPKCLSLLLSGACDGQVKLWNLATRTCVSTVQAHDGLVKGISSHPHGHYFFTCGTDKTIKQWQLTDDYEVLPDPSNTILGKTLFYDMDHHWQDNVFATCGERVDIWHESRTEPIRSFTWGVESIHSLRFNPVEVNTLAAVASDRSVMLYDMRGSNPLRKVILKLKSNVLAWNPMEAYMFTVANEDYNLYSFDTRKLKAPLSIHKDHVAAVFRLSIWDIIGRVRAVSQCSDQGCDRQLKRLHVFLMDVDYAPTGKEFVTAGYDKSIRIFPVDKAYSRDIYHTKRMQKVLAVKWSLDNKYVLSASEEMNIRVWKARASQKPGMLTNREKAAFDYNEKLKQKYEFHPQIRNIARHRHVPKKIFCDRREHMVIRQKNKRKQRNRQENRKSTAVLLPEKESKIVEEME